MDKLLVTGFYGPGTEPRPDHINNPSGILAEHLHGQTVAGHEIEGVVINEPLRDRPAAVRELMESVKPLAYLALGVTTTTHKCLFMKSIENEINTTALPDHTEGQIADDEIVRNGPRTLTNETVDFDQLAQRFDDEGLPHETVRRVVGAGAITVAYAQLYYGSPDMPRLSLLIPPDVDFAEWVEDYNDQIVVGTMDLEVSQRAAELALETLVASRAIR